MRSDEVVILCVALRSGGVIACRPQSADWASTHMRAWYDARNGDEQTCRPSIPDRLLSMYDALYQKYADPTVGVTVNVASSEAAPYGGEILSTSWLAADVVAMYLGRPDQPRQTKESACPTPSRN